MGGRVSCVEPVPVVVEFARAMMWWACARISGVISMLDATVRPEPHLGRGFDLEGLLKQSIGYGKFGRRSSPENESGTAAIDRPTAWSRAYIGQKIRVAARVLLETSAGRVCSVGHQGRDMGECQTGKRKSRLRDSALWRAFDDCLLKVGRFGVSRN